MTSNRQLYIDNTDTVESLEFIRLDHKYVKVHILSTAIAYLAIMALLPLLLLSDLNHAGLIVAATEASLAIAMTINLCLAGAIWRAKGYALREHDISYRSGIIFPKTATIPFCKIQQVSVRQSIVSRFMGLYYVDILNGSQKMMSQLSIPGLTPEDADRLKATLLQKTEYAGN